MNSGKIGHRDEKYDSVSTWLDICSANLPDFSYVGSCQVSLSLTYAVAVRDPSGTYLY
jgi:hypothetical protein